MEPPQHDGADLSPHSPHRLFGPKRKMTSAIARWHSSARPPSDALELAYADRLEAEMQELAIQLHKVNGERREGKCRNGEQTQLATGQ